MAKENMRFGRLTHEEREARGERAERHREAGLCHVGSSTDNPCWRPATEKRWVEDEEPKYCPEHLVCLKLREEADNWQFDLYKIEDWIRGPVADTPSGDLERLAFNMRDEARREYARLTIEAEAAGIVADVGPDDAPIASEANLELTRRIMHADALANARTILEDLPEGLLETVLKGVDRWLVVDALDTAATTASEEAEHYKRESGLSR